MLRTAPPHSEGSAMIGRRELTLAGLLALAGIAHYGVRLTSKRPGISQEGFRSVTPPRVGDFRFTGEDGVVLPIEDDLTKILYSNTRFGTYSNGIDPAIMLLVAYDRAQEYDVQIHRPESCYPAAGFHIDHRAHVQTDDILGQKSEAVFLTASRSDRVEQILYWTRIGNQFPADYAAQRIAILKSNFSGVVPDAVLIRISMISTDRAKAFTVLGGFMKNMVSEIAGTARQVYLGDSVTT